MSSKLQGLIAAPHTPFDPRGDVHLAAIDGQIEWLVQSGVRGAYVCGTTGEGMSMTVAERKAVAAHWAGNTGGRLDVMIHVGHQSQRDAIDLARHADTLDNIHSISAIAPCFFKPQTIDSLIDWLRPIAAASKRPFYYYHSPGMTGVDFPLEDFLLQAADVIPTFAGTKFNSGDLYQYQRALAVSDAIDLPFGTDEVLLGALAVGARSAIGSTYNFAAPLYLALWRAYESGDAETARELAQKSVTLVQLLIRYGVLAGGKALMSLRGVDCGAPRSPVAPLTDAKRQSLFASVQELGILDILHPETATV